SCWQDTGHKWFYIQPRNEPTPGEAVWTAHEGDDTWRVLDANNRVNINASRALNIRDSEMALEFRFIAESRPGAGGGSVHSYLQGRHLGSDNRVAMSRQSSYGAVWDNLHFYAAANNGPGGTSCYFDVREFYVSGK